MCVESGLTGNIPDRQIGFPQQFYCMANPALGDIMRDRDPVTFGESPAQTAPMDTKQGRGLFHIELAVAESGFDQGLSLFRDAPACHFRMLSRRNHRQDPESHRQCLHPGGTVGISFIFNSTSENRSSGQVPA